jgi:uncharacterized protein YaeQ
MALKSTVLKLSLSLSDLDRNHFADYTLTVAQHPSETAERVMVRVLAFALHAGPDLRFGKGLSSDEEAAVWEIDPTGAIELWIEVGLPDESRIRKACGRAARVVLITYGGKSADLWWRQNADVLARHSNLEVFQLGFEDGEKLARLAERNMKLTWTIQEGTIYLGDDSISLVRKSA